jgi:hypothetical protein
MYVGTIDLTPSRLVFTVAQLDGRTVRITPQPDINLYDRQQTLLGETAQLIQILVEMLRQPEVGRSFLGLAYAHAERDKLTHFTARLPSTGNELYLRHEPDGAMHPIQEMELVGALRWKQEPLDMHLAEFLETRFSFGQSTVAGRDILAVALMDALDNTDDTNLHIRGPGTPHT